MVTGGIIYDVIVEPPSVGSTTDEQGHTRPVAFMPYRWRSLNYFLCLDLNYFLYVQSPAQTYFGSRQSSVFLLDIL